MSPLGIDVLLGCALVWLAARVWPAPDGLAARRAAILAVSVAMLAAWLFYFNGDAVRRVGFAYAERLFECLSSLPAAPRKRAAKAE